MYYQLDAGKDVYIIYSDNQSDVYDDKFETDYNGIYRFEYLRKGDYTIYTYADSTVYLDPSDPENFQKAAQENTRAIFVESLGNPKLDVLDIAAISVAAKAHKVPLIVDNTVATPYLLNPIEYGANIVIHSLTKYINIITEIKTKKLIIIFFPPAATASGTE